jgi:hypothetical protein
MRAAPRSRGGDDGPRNQGGGAGGALPPTFCYKTARDRGVYDNYDYGVTKFNNKLQQAPASASPVR